MEDVECRLAFHARHHRVLVEGFERLHGRVVTAPDGNLAVLFLMKEHDDTRLQVRAVAHRFGDDDLTLWSDLCRSVPVKRNPVTYHDSPPVPPMP